MAESHLVQARWFPKTKDFEVKERLIKHGRLCKYRLEIHEQEKPIIKR